MQSLLRYYRSKPGLKDLQTTRKKDLLVEFGEIIEEWTEEYIIVFSQQPRPSIIQMNERWGRFLRPPLGPIFTAPSFFMPMSVNSFIHHFSVHLVLCIVSFSSATPRAASARQTPVDMGTVGTLGCGPTGPYSSPSRFQHTFLNLGRKDTISPSPSNRSSIPPLRRIPQ